MSLWRRRLLRQGAASASLIAALLVANAPSVGADAPTYDGWWTSANPGVSNSSVPTFVPSGGGPGGSPSDVPPGGLEVSSLPGDDSMAAIGYFSQGSAVTKVVLHQTSDSATVPGSQVEACPLTGTGFFTPAHGAPAAQEPKYSCNTHVAGVVDASAGTVSFSVGSYVHNNYLGIAIVAVGTSRMVFDAPGKDAIALAPAPAAPGTQPGAAPAPAGGPASGPAAASSGAVAAGRPASGYVSAGPSPAGGSSNAGPASAATGQAASPPASLGPASPRPAAGSSGQSVLVTDPINTVGTGSAVVGFLLIFAGAVLVSRRNRRLIASSQ